MKKHQHQDNYQQTDVFQQFFEVFLSVPFLKYVILLLFLIHS